MNQVRRYATIAGALILTGAAIHLTPQVRIDSEPGVRLPLPERLGSWSGTPVWFCQSEACMASGDASPIPEACPTCEGPVDAWAPGERRGLPPDTEIERMQYRRADRRPIAVSVVVAGRHRKSIHRPEDCLTGQGFRIEGWRHIGVDLPGERELPVSVFRLVQPKTRGSRHANEALYAYWFVGGDYTTARHTTRLLRTAWERLVRGRMSRWCYVTVGCSVPVGDEEEIADLVPFLRLLASSLLTSSAPQTSHSE